MHLAQVEHWWLNDYVTVSASVSGELLPTSGSVTFHEVTQSINLLTAQVLIFRHDILVRSVTLSTAAPFGHYSIFNFNTLKAQDRIGQ